jgi:uncharacterized protein
MTQTTRLPSAALAWAAALFVLLAAFAGHADPTFPPLTGRVVDDANILSPQTEADLTAKLQALEEKTGRQLVVATLPSLQGYEIEEYGYQLGRAWKIGQKGEDNGALLIVAPNEHKVRVEVGYGLEGVLTDALSSVILQQRVLPRFRAGDMEGGVVSGTEALIDQLSLGDAEAKQRVAQAAAHKPGTRGVGPGQIFAIVLILFVLATMFRGGAWWLLPFIFSGGGRGGGGGGWSSGGGGWSSGGGGGGFSGGGGSFGGGGSSGSW